MCTQPAASKARQLLRGVTSLVRAIGVSRPAGVLFSVTRTVARAPPVIEAAWKTTVEVLRLPISYAGLVLAAPASVNVERLHVPPEQLYTICSSGVTIVSELPPEPIVAVLPSRMSRLIRSSATREAPSVSARAVVSSVRLTTTW